MTYNLYIPQLDILVTIEDTREFFESLKESISYSWNKEYLTDKFPYSTYRQQKEEIPLPNLKLRK